jgi:hypothetical protein
MQLFEFEVEQNCCFGVCLLSLVLYSYMPGKSTKLPPWLKASRGVKIETSLRSYFRLHTARDKPRALIL